MKKIVILVVIVLVTLFALSGIKNGIAKAAVAGGVRAMTGLKLNMRSMNVGIIKTLIGIKGLKLYNPPGFKDKLMVDMPEIYVDYDLGAFFKRKVHLQEVRLNLNEFIVVKSAEGKVNLDVFKKDRAKKEERPAKKKKSTRPKFQIDVLQLKVNKVIYKDYTQGPEPKITEYDVNIDERYENITNPQALVSIILVRTLLKTAVANLADFDLGPFKSEMSETLQKAQEVANKAAEFSKKLGIGTKDNAEEAAEKAADALKKLFPIGK